MAITNQSIIIKRVKKVAAGHHGGAWKVAYADFVTAMMAFFLLLWLLNATEAENLAGLADYFAPTIGIKDQMGIGFRGGKAALSEGIGADKNTNKGIVFGGIPTGPITKVTTKIEERTDQPDQEQIQLVINEAQTEKKGTLDQQENRAVSDNPVTPVQTQEQQQEQQSEEMQKTQQALETVIDDMIKNKKIDEGAIEIKRTPEGLVIEIKDISGDSLFETGSAVMRPKLKVALADLAKILKNVPNNYALVGHTSSAAIVSKKGDYGKWELSADRADATRTFLEKSGVQAEQFSRIEGRADNVPYDPSKPESNINNRVDIIILTKSDTPEHKRATPNALLIDTKSEQSKKFIEENEPKKEDKAVAPTTENTEAKKVFEESSKTRSESVGAKPIPENEKPDLIDLKIQKKKQEQQKGTGGGAGSTVEKILNEVAEPKKAPTGTQLPAKNADIIDLSVEQKKKEQPKPADKNINNTVEKIFEETAAPKVPTLPAKSADIIDLKVEKKEQEQQKGTGGGAGSTVEKILNEVAEPKKAPTGTQLPAKNADIIDLSVEQKKKEQPKPADKNINNTVEKIFEETAAPKVPTLPAKSADIIDLKVEKKEQEQLKETEKGTNSIIEKIFKETAAPKVSTGTQLPAKSADIIDLKVEKKEKEKEQPKPADKNINNVAKKIFDEEAKPKVPAGTELPVKNADIIDLSIEEKKKEQAKPVNKNINNEAEKIFEETDAPKSNIDKEIPDKNADLIDLSVDKKPEETKEQTEPENKNRLFEGIMNEIEQLRKKKDPN